MDVLINWMGESFHNVDIYQVITFYTLNILLFIRQLILGKAEKNKILEKNENYGKQLLKFGSYQNRNGSQNLIGWESPGDLSLLSHTTARELQIY